MDIPCFSLLIYLVLVGLVLAQTTSAHLFRGQVLIKDLLLVRVNILGVDLLLLLLPQPCCWTQPLSSWTWNTLLPRGIFRRILVIWTRSIVRPMLAFWEVLLLIKCLGVVGCISLGIKLLSSRRIVRCFAFLMIKVQILPFWQVVIDILGCERAGDTLLGVRDVLKVVVAHIVHAQIIVGAASGWMMAGLRSLDLLLHLFIHGLVAQGRHWTIEWFLQLRTLFLILRHFILVGNVNARYTGKTCFSVSNS